MKHEFAQLAHSFNPRADYTGWYASRKLNGWGCLWDGGITRGMIAKDVPWYYEGGDKKLRHCVMSTGLWTIGRANKYGIRPKVINCPSWYLDKLPKGIPLHGELWKDDSLKAVKSICGQGVNGLTDNRWKGIKYLVYNVKPYECWAKDTVTSLGFIMDAFDKEESMLSFVANNVRLRERLLLAKRTVSPKFYDVGNFEEQTRLETKGDLQKMIDTAAEYKWEGIMLADPAALYESGRSYNLLKCKPKYDAEAVIIGYEDGHTGKNIGKLGCLICKMKWGNEVLSVTGGDAAYTGLSVSFGVSGMDDYQREWTYVVENYPLGKEIKFTYVGVTDHGIPSSCNITKSL